MFRLSPFHFYIIILIPFLSCACGNNYAPNSSVNQKSQKAKLYTFTENGIILRSGPGEQFEKVLNEEASEVMHQTQYAEVDKSVAVEIEEVDQQWSKIRVIQPGWLTASHVGWVQTKYLIEPDAVPKPKTIARKLKIFNNISYLRSKLSGIGIGKLCEWKSDDFGGYTSLTDYYRFGEPFIQNGMENNLAYYLESENENYVETLSLVLNINNNAEEKQALERFNQVARETFLVIGIRAPSGLQKAILKKEKFVNESAAFKIEMLINESKIETLELNILAR